MSSMGSSPEPVVPAYRRLRMPWKRPQVLVADLNRSVSSRRIFGVDFVELFRRSCKPVLKVCKFGSSNSPRARAASFDHLVGGDEQLVGHSEAKHPPEQLKPRLEHVEVVVVVFDV